MSMRLVPMLMLSACATQAPPMHYVAPPTSMTAPEPVVEMAGGVTLDVEADVDGKVKAEGFPAVSTDGRVLVAIQELGDGMRGFPYVVMRVFDATKGGAAAQTLPIVETSDTAERPDDATEKFLLDRVRPRLAAVRAVLRDKKWITLAPTGLGVTFEQEKLLIEDTKTGRKLHERRVETIDQKECVFEPYEPSAVSDPKRRFVLEKVSYRSGPDWCNMDDDLALVLPR